MNLDLDRKTITAIAALFVSSYVLMFVLGYYVGKKNALDEFSENIKQDAFSDRVYASLYTLSEGHDHETQDHAVTEEPQEAEASLEEEPKADAVSDSGSSKLYFAVLVGFGAEGSARKYKNSLKARGVPSRILERLSKTARGATRTWYQVATEPASLLQTQEWVHRVSLADKLQGVVIKEYEQSSNELPNQE